MCVCSPFFITFKVDQPRQELLLYLLQLVQALKFESAASEQRSARSTTSAISYDDSGLTDFLIVRGVANQVLGNRLYWYLMVEVALEDRVMAKMYGRVVFKFMNKILEVRLTCMTAVTLSADFAFLVSRGTARRDESLCDGRVSSSILSQNVQKNSVRQRTPVPRRSRNSALSSLTPRITWHRCHRSRYPSMHALR